MVAGRRSVGGALRRGGGMIGRLARMSADELIGRSRQAAAKLLERSGVLARPRLGPDHRLSLQRFRAVTPRRFFDGAASERTLRLVLDRMPAARDEAVAIADAACVGRFDLLGYKDLSFGDPIDWSLDPVSGRRAPADHWSRLDPLDPRAVGDSKVVWELNRHQWMVRLGQAYRLTGDLRFARAFTDGRRAVDRRESTRRGHQLGEQPRGRSAADRVVLGARAVPGSAAADAGVVRQDHRIDLGARHARRALPLHLLLAEHASDGRGARARLRGPAPSGAAARRPLARPRHSRSWWTRARATSFPMASTSSSRPATSATRSSSISTS